MPSQIEPYFNTEESISALRRLSSLLSDEQKPNNSKPEVKDVLNNIIRLILSNPQTFDSHCQTNIKWIGHNFLQMVKQYRPENKDAATEQIDLFTSAYRFLCELEFSAPDNQSIEQRAIRSYVDENIESFEGVAKRQLIFANYLMPAAIARELIQHPDISAIREFNKGQVSAQKLKAEWDSEIEKKRLQVDALKDLLDHLESGYNFVGLVDGFRGLVKQKNKEKFFAFLGLLALGVCTIIPIFVEGIFIAGNFADLDKFKGVLIFVIPPLIALEVLLIYFFRIVLAHFRSIKAQLLQLELRTALCQFIQSYSSYSTQIKSNNSGALEKFESLIFSGLISNEENLPSTFDGTEQLAKLFGQLKK